MGKDGGTGQSERYDTQELVIVLVCNERRMRKVALPKFSSKIEQTTDLKCAMEKRILYSCVSSL